MANSGDGTSAPFSSAAKGIFPLLLSLICLGTWPALLRLCSDNELNNSAPFAADAPLRTTRRALAQRRHPCHAHMDYALAYVVFSLTLPLIISHSSARDGGEYPVEDDDNHQDGSEAPSPAGQLPLVAIAVVGGAMLSLGNISTQWSTTVFSLPLTTVLSVQASLCVVLGTSLNYVLEPEKIAFPALLVCGVVAFLAAIAASVLAQGSYEASKFAGGEFSAEKEVDGVGISMHATKETSRGDYLACLPDGEPRSNDEAELVASKEEQDLSRKGPETFGTASIGKGWYLDSPCAASLHVASHSSLTFDLSGSLPSAGMLLALCGGLCFGFFSPAFNIAVNDPFGFNGGVGLSVANANACFGFSFATTSMLWNLYVMVFPPSKAPSVIQSSSFWNYLAERCSQRSLALAAGVVCALGNVLQFQGGHLAGFAAADLVQAFPLVATAWDLLLFEEFLGAPAHVLLRLWSMYAAYAAGIVLLTLSIAR